MLITEIGVKVAKDKPSIEFTKDWQGLVKMAQKHPEILKRRGRKLLSAFALVIKGKARKAIQTEKTQTNAALTAELKGDNKPLVGPNADLFQSITHKVKGSESAFVGVFRQDVENYNTGVIVHEGAVIPVTKKMRAMFMVLANATIKNDPTGLYGRAKELYKPGLKIKPLKKSTRQIIIPPRPFFKIAIEMFSDSEKKKLLKRHGDKLVKDIAREVRKG